MFEAADDHLNDLFPRPDLVILSWESVNDGTAAEYRVARDILDRIEVLLLLRLIPGNHDDGDGFRQCFADHAYLPASGPLHFAADSDGRIRIIGLDVTIPGRHRGDIDDDAVR